MLLNKGKYNQGQVGLTVLLIAVVLVTVGVAVAGRSVSQLKISRLEEESTRSLNMAESGVEKILSDPGHYATLGPGFKFVDVNGKPLPFVMDNVYKINGYGLDSGHVVDVNLSGFNELGHVVNPGNPNLPSIDIMWTQPVSYDCSIDVTNMAAIEVTVVKENGDLRRYAFDPCDMPNRDPDNNFDPAALATDPDLGPIAYVNLSGLNSTTSPDHLVRIKAFYATTKVTIKGGSDGEGLPSQGLDVTVKDPEGTDNTTRAANQTYYAGALPSIFDYVLFSGTDIVKN